MSTPRYIIISPVRDEASSLPLTIASVAAQTVLPVLWVLVDDGSSDTTGAIIAEAARLHPWILGISRRDRGGRRAGGGVVEAFNDGLCAAQGCEWDYIAKLDGDLEFSPDYFETCLRTSEAETRLGILGGLVCIERDGRLVAEYNDPCFHVRGPSKIYRRECWEQIEGLIAAPGWDTFDLIKAQRLGWKTTTLKAAHLRHCRPTGSAYGAWSNWMKNGLANYIVGYHPLFMLVKSARRVFRRPFGLAGAALLAGFIRGYVRRIPQVQDRQTIAYLRQQQLNFFVGRESLWRPRSDPIQANR